MKIKLLKVISIILCLCSILLLSVAGCKTQEQDDNTGKPSEDIGKTDNDGVPKKSGLHITVKDLNNKILYSSSSKQTETLSLEEEYYFFVEAGGGAFVGYGGIHMKYDEECIEISPLPEPYDGEIYYLRGLKECTNCLVECFTIRYYIDSDGHIKTDGEIDRYCSIVISFS